MRRALLHMAVGGAALAGLVGAVAGCGGPATKTGGVPAASRAGQTATPAASASASSVAVGTKARRIPECTLAGLRVAVSGIQGATGNYAVPITFTNVGHGSCWLRGYPGVSWVDRQGRTIGDPARRATGERVRRVVLKPHRSATSLVLEPTPSNQQLAACTEKTAYGLRVYPPGSRRSYVITHDGRGWRDILEYCANGATVAVVMPVEPR